MLKETELRIVSELIKNSRRSDRELARAIGVSQPTVTRLRQKLEKEGMVKEYTMIPDFQKLGFQLLAIIFLKLQHAPSQKELDNMYEAARKVEKDSPRRFLLAMNGMGLGQDMVVIAFFKDYSEYVNYVRTVKGESTGGFIPFLDAESIQSFLVNLNDNTHYQPLTLSRIAAHLQKIIKQKAD
jgi:DNA-binding Lrp family transcriptional regulator